MTDRPKAGKVPSPTVVVAQLVESQIVILVVAGSSPVGHPISILEEIRIHHSVGMQKHHKWMKVNPKKHIDTFYGRHTVSL